MYMCLCTHMYICRERGLQWDISNRGKRSRHNKDRYLKTEHRKLADGFDEESKLKRNIKDDI